MMETNHSDNAQQSSKLSMMFNTAALLLMTACAVFAFTISDWFGSDTFNLALIPFSVILIYGIASLLKDYFQNKTTIEEEDRILLEKTRQSRKTFDSEEDILFTASRTLKNYTKFAPFIIAILTSIGISAGLFFYWNFWQNEPGTIVPAKPTQAAFIAFIFALITFFSGIFCVGQSRIRSFRWLRPVGIWQILFSLLMVSSIVAILFKATRVPQPQWDNYISRIFFAIFALLALELLINFIIEFYRPRTEIEERPVFESRLLSILTEPGGILRNLADTLDYQFGFQVSGTWIYRFLEKSISPLLLTWFLLFWIATAFDEVPPGYMGVRECFGERTSGALDAGFYLKWPWPIAKIRKFPVEKIQQIFIGPELKNKKGEEQRPDVVLWTQSHYAKEKPFLIATKNTPSDDSEKNGNVSSVALISALLPVQFKIKPDKLIDYAYMHKDPVQTLKYISEKEVSTFFATSAMMKVMSVGREKAINTLQDRIQKKADQIHLGVDIVAVALLDAHPPIQIGGESGDNATGLPAAFQNVIKAKEQKETKVLEAERYKSKTIPAAQAQAYKLISEANSYRNFKIKVSESEMARFTKRLAGYRAMPSQYILNEKMKFLENECGGLRKYIVPSSSKNDVYVINLEEKRRLDLIDLNDLKDQKDSGNNK